MINSISSMTSMMSMRSGTMQHRPPPPDNDVFQLSDSDSDGSLAIGELESLVEIISETTGTTINAQEAMTTYDTDGDRGLSGEELLSLMTDSGFAPPPGGKNGAPPPPPPTEQVLASYAGNSGQDLITELLHNLQNGEDVSEEESSIDIIS